MGKGILEEVQIPETRTEDWPTGGTDTRDTDTLSGIHLRREISDHETTVSL